MQETQTEHAPANTQRGKGRRKAALHLFLLLGLPLLLLSSVFLTGAYWGSSRIPVWLLEKEEAWLGWKAKPEILQAAQLIENRRQGLGIHTPDSAIEIPPEKPAPLTPANGLAKNLAQPEKKPEPAPQDSPEPVRPENTEKAPEPEPPKKAEPPAESAEIKGAMNPEAVRERTPPAKELPTLENPGARSPEPQRPPTNRGSEPTTAKDRFDLPAKVGVMLVVDSQAFPGSDGCTRARSALHSANIQFRAWLNLSLDGRGCLPWVAKSDQKKERGAALAALDLPGTDLLLVLTRPGRVQMPSLDIERDVFNSGLTLALVPGGADDAGMRRAMLHALGLALGAKPIEDGGSPDARRGSVMNTQAGLRRDWLDEPNRWRMLERKQWPFARRRKQGER